MFFMEDDDDSYDDSYYSDSYLYDTDDDYHYNPNSPLLRERMQWLKVRVIHYIRYTLIKNFIMSISTVHSVTEY